MFVEGARLKGLLIANILRGPAQTLYQCRHELLTDGLTKGWRKFELLS